MESKMKTFTSLAAALVLAAPLAAQTVTTIGGTASSPTRTANGKGNGISIKSSVLLLDFDMYLNVPGQETLQFFIYHHHSEKGTFRLVNSWNVKVNGTGVGAKWYSSGPKPTPLLCGNSYILGVAWTGSVTYHYSRSTCGSAFALGRWLFGRTANTVNPLPPTFGSGCDVAQYRQRFRTLPFGNVACVGTGCSASAGTAPRLVATTPPRLGTTLTIQLVGGTASVPAVFLFSPAPTLSNPINLAGCPVWLNLKLPVITLTAPLSSVGEGILKIPVPSNTAYRGVKVATQAGVLGKLLDITNAIDLIGY
jgi:hypothetical protein